MGFSKSNLQPDSQQWGREVESRLTDLESAVMRGREMETALDATLKANFQTTGVIQTALEDTLTYLRGLTFRYATFKSGATWSGKGTNTTDTLIPGTEFYIDLERRPKNASAFITVTCDVDLSCRNSTPNVLMQQNISQYIYIQSFAGSSTNPWANGHTTTNASIGQYKNGYLLNKSNTKSGIKTSAASNYLLGGSNITTTAGIYLNPAFAYRITTRLTKYTAAAPVETGVSDTAAYGGNVSPQSMTIQITP